MPGRIAGHRHQSRPKISVELSAAAVVVPCAAAGVAVMAASAVAGMTDSQAAGFGSAGFADRQDHSRAGSALTRFRRSARLIPPSARDESVFFQRRLYCLPPAWFAQI